MNALPRLPRSSVREEHQAQLWQKVLAYERSNPQRLDPLPLRARVMFVYNQCLLCLYFYPSVWCVVLIAKYIDARFRYEYACWLAEVGATEYVIDTYDRALRAIPNNLVNDDRSLVAVAKCFCSDFALCEGGLLGVLGTSCCRRSSIHWPDGAEG